MRTVDEAVSDIKSILNNIERTEECYGETLVDIDELCDEILTISCRPQKSQGDRIRAMSDEELAELLCGVYDEGSAKFISGIVVPHYDEDVIAEWLKSEAKE